MTYISLREIIDDILLLVRNNYISESEDLSRAQIEAWVNAYRRQLWRERKDQLKDRIKSTDPTIQDLLSLVDDEFFKVKETGPHKIVPVESLSDTPTFTKVTEDEFNNIFDNCRKSILSVHDQLGENIQIMDHMRRYYQYHRKYTFGEMTAYFNETDKKIYVQGLVDQYKLQYIYVLALYELDEDDADDDDPDKDDEDKIKIPSWMVPTIKQRIMQNELAFMLNRPSDDSNNATLASVKPHGPQDQEE